MSYVRNLAQWLIVVSIIANLPAEAQQQALTLACEGTSTWSHDENFEKPQDVSMGIIFNFATGAVAGFDMFASGLGIYYEAKIIGANDTTIVFRSGGSDKRSDILDGTIDRITGKLDATTTSLGENNKVISTTRYELHCKPSQRMF